jgi:hypothetical protein
MSILESEQDTESLDALDGAVLIAGSTGPSSRSGSAPADHPDQIRPEVFGAGGSRYASILTDGLIALRSSLFQSLREFDELQAGSKVVAQTQALDLRPVVGIGAKGEPA